MNTAQPHALAAQIDLIEELKDDAAKMKFQTAVEDLEDESSVSVYELRKAFPEEADILDKVGDWGMIT